MIKNMLAGFVVAAAMASVAHAEDKVVRIGTEADYAPFESMDASGKFVGFEIELGQKICEASKIKCEFVNSDFDGLIAALNANKIDAILSQMSVTDERKKSVDFSNLVTAAPVAYVAKKGSGITEDPKTLKGKIVGIQSGTTHETYINETLKGAFTVKVYPSLDPAYLDLQAGRVDAILADKTVEWDWLDKTGLKEGFGYAGKTIVDVKYFGEGTGIAVRKGDAALLKAFNDGLAVAFKDGTYKALNAKYFPFDISVGK